MSKTRIALAYLTEHQHQVDPFRVRAALASPQPAFDLFEAASGIDLDRQQFEVSIVPLQAGQTGSEIARVFRDDARKHDIRVICYDANEALDFSMFNGSRLLVAIAMGADRVSVQPLPNGLTGCAIHAPEALFMAVLHAIRLEFALARSPRLARATHSEPLSRAEKSFFLKKANFFRTQFASLCPSTATLTYAPLCVSAIDGSRQTNGALFRKALEQWDRFLVSECSTSFPDYRDGDRLTAHLKSWRYASGQIGARQHRVIAPSLKPGANLIIRLSKSVSSRVSPDIRDAIQPYFRKDPRVNSVRVLDPFAGFDDKNLRTLLREQWLDSFRYYAVDGEVR